MKQKLQIVADEAIPFLRGVLEPYAEIHYLPGEQISNQNIKQADALLVRTRTNCNLSLLQNTAVQMVATATIGMDHLDTDFLRKAGIHFTNAPACNAGSVVQYIIAVLLEIAKKKSLRLKDLTLGIVGVGNIGSQVFEVAKHLGVKTLLCDPPKKDAELIENAVSFDFICQYSDIITFHTPLTRQGKYPTYHLLNHSALSLLKKNAWIINAARGEVIDGQALLEALKNRICSGAVLDVWENEPKIDQNLLQNVFIATPHIAGYSLDGKANATEQVVRQVAHFFDIPELKNFKVTSLPLTTPIRVKFSEVQSFEEQLHFIFKQSYDILLDDAFLRKNPDKFEVYRKKYPVRREALAYTLHLEGALPETIEFVKFMGFNVVVEN